MPSSTVKERTTKVKVAGKRKGWSLAASSRSCKHKHTKVSSQQLVDPADDTHFDKDTVFIVAAKPADFPEDCMMNYTIA
jgi:hypothetical protein